MAGAPAEAPESILLQQFLGLRNNVAEERLAPGELSIARNVLIDDVGQLRMRGGFERHDSDVYHSFKAISGRRFGVKNGILGTFALNRTFTPITTVGADSLSYTAVGGDVFVSSVSFSAKISAANVVSAWGDNDAPTTWLSPVLTPTSTLGEIAGRLVSAPPMASIVEYYNGRAYLAVGKILWFTELYLYDLVDRTKNYVQFEDEITLVAAMSDGLYVGTTAGLYFLKGTQQGLARSEVLPGPVMRGSAVAVPTSHVHPSARQQPLPEGTAMVFMTQAGICAGLDNGVAYNLTQDRVKFPELTAGAALWRDDLGCSTYIYSDVDGTAWAMNTRTGAVTEYANYTFDSFMPAGDTYFGAAPGGLYTFDAADDEGVEIALQVRSGLMRFGGPRLSRLKAVYVTMRAGADVELLIETGEGVEYRYSVTSVTMRTMKVHMGKGQRATQFLFELTGSALDLDMVEFLPLVVSRRV